MSASFLSWPVLTDELACEAGYVPGEIVLTCTDDGVDCPLQLEEEKTGRNGGRGNVRDRRCAWSPETHNLILSRTCRLTCAYVLFGPHGIAPAGSTIGVALRWISTRSSIRGTIPFGEICDSDTTAEFSFTHTFDRGTLRGSLRLETVLYLKSAGTPPDGDARGGPSPGAILGQLDSWELCLDGNGSLFPVSVVNRPGGPLWEVWFSSLDPMEDRFEADNVEIRLNEAHRSWRQLETQSSLADSPLLLEVLSAALTLICLSAKEQLEEDWEDVMRGEHCGEGSIAAAMRWFAEKLEWDFSSPIKLAASIHAFLEKQA